MKVVLKNDEYTIYQRRDGRYAVEGAGKKSINGDDKVAILVANDLIKAALPAAPEPEPVEETAEEEAAEEETEEGEAAGNPVADDVEPAEDAKSPAEEADDKED